MEREFGWFDTLLKTPGVELMNVKEWQDEDWRSTQEAGFSGRDYMHSSSSAVRIFDYAIIPPEISLSSSENDSPSEVVDRSNGKLYPRLIAPVHFTPQAESHRGFCHGGSMCAVMDDAVGWVGFTVTGETKPWSGFTVQVNTAMKKPVQVGALLKLEAWVSRREGDRKFWVAARLTDPVDESIVFCEGEGLFLLSRE